MDSPIGAALDSCKEQEGGKRTAALALPQDVALDAKEPVDLPRLFVGQGFVFWTVWLQASEEPFLPTQLHRMGPGGVVKDVHEPREDIRGW